MQANGLTKNKRGVKSKRDRSFIFILSIMLLAILSCSLPSAIVDAIRGIDTADTDCDAETFEVTETFDANDGACNSQCTLREAVIAANTCAGPDVIEIPSGTYTVTLRGSGDERGDLDVTDDVTIQGAGFDNTTITGASDWNDRIFEIAGNDESTIVATIQNVAIHGGDTSQDGGGIRNNGTLTLDRVRVEENFAGRGAGIANYGTLDMVNTAIFNNSTNSHPDGSYFIGAYPYGRGQYKTKCGGGIYNSGRYGVDPRITLRNSMVSDNSSYVGGGICNSSQGVMEIIGTTVRENGDSFTHMGGGIANYGLMTLTGTTVDDNVAGLGGGIYSLHGIADSEPGDTQPVLTIIDSVISNNATGTGVGMDGSDYGGGILIASGDFWIEDTQIVDNRANRIGGGVHISSMPRNLVYYFPYPSGEIHRSAIVRNEAVGSGEVNAGGIYVDLDVDLVMSNVTISENFSQGPSGGLHVEGSAILDHLTIVANDSAAQGGGIHVGDEGFVDIRSSIVVQNLSNQCRIYGTLVSSGYNIQQYNVCQFDHITDRWLDPTGASGGAILASLLTPMLQEEAGTYVHPLTPMSMAFDYIRPDECTTTVDQRSEVRPAAEGCDAGAYELQVAVLGGQPTTEALIETPTPQPSAIVATSSTGDVPMVVTDTLCWKGPGAQYETVSSLLAGTKVDILGRGEEGDWWVLDNPRYPGVECWAPGEDIQVEPDFVVPGTIFPVPPLPTPTPTPTPILGCLYQGQNDNNPVCYKIEQCPVDFVDSLGACTP